VRVRRKDGQYRWFLIRYNPLFDAQRRLTRWCAAGTDIDDGRQGEEKLREENIALREKMFLGHYVDVYAQGLCCLECSPSERIAQNFLSMTRAESKISFFSIDRVGHLSQAIRSKGSGHPSQLLNIVKFYGEKIRTKLEPSTVLSNGASGSFAGQASMCQLGVAQRQFFFANIDAMSRDRRPAVSGGLCIRWSLYSLVRFQLEPGGPTIHGRATDGIL
jgi:PAS domain-containing protein